MELATRRERDISVPWLAKVRRLMASRCYWQASVEIRKRLQLWPAWLIMTSDVEHDFDDHVTFGQVLQFLIGVGLISSDVATRLRRYDDYLYLVMLRRIEPTVRVLQRVFDDVSTWSDAEAALFPGENQDDE